MSNACKSNKNQEFPHHHADGRRCCGRLLTEKCTPEEEAANTNTAGEKSCCKGHHLPMSKK